ncbi:MAG: sigma 54-interacting transcriptional regulator [Chitinophaga sp.]|uniref:sigma 54-interacting response regulator n=1 Tax=Chitinophaga sp. TaxID=1869181 RepID=UPI001B0F3D4C|nr:sigma 54-interacting response regulator [Chitinophaga sp.]MBO9727107.1 sigma 54-interacting transcriptional regulator [Chitinophaga sp.]
MEKKILIVEDEFVVANDLRLILQRSGYFVCGIADSVSEAIEIINKHAPSLVLLDIYLKGKETGIDLAKFLTEKNIGFVYLSANSNQVVLEDAKATKPYGFLIKPFREKDILIMLDIAYYRHAHSMEVKLSQRQALQISIINILSEQVAWENRLLNLSKLFQPYIPFDFIGLGLERQVADISIACSFLRIGFNEYQVINLPDLIKMMNLSEGEYKRERGDVVYEQSAFYNGADFENACKKYRIKGLFARLFKVESNLMMPFTLGNGERFLISFYSKNPDAYQVDHLVLLENLQHSFALTLDRQLALDEVARLSEKLKNENKYLIEEVKTRSNFEEIIGTSNSLLKVFDQVTQVAYLDTSVLLLGESGTGKELIARAIHNLSPRREKVLIKVNCAALPSNLIESELFGHEKGAFTGAIDKRIGKFELAQGSTIFLDEIGEMPLDLQVKLLRVLQEREIERIGGKQTIKIDVRVIAATNRNLEREIAEGRFRLDLYYRLNVFPLTLPPLRDRREDIPMLANFFAQKFSKKTGKPFTGISSTALKQLMQYDWPGNIREMENILEQAFVLSDGKSELELGRVLYNTAGQADNNSKSQAPPKNLGDVRELQQATEREYILSILKQTNGRIRGVGGAAELLNIKPTTLESKMEKLGIKKIHAVKKEDGLT